MMQTITIQAVTPTLSTTGNHYKVFGCRGSFPWIGAPRTVVKLRRNENTGLAAGCFSHSSKFTICRCCNAVLVIRAILRHTW